MPSGQTAQQCRYYPLHKSRGAIWPSLQWGHTSSRSPSDSRCLGVLDVPVSSYILLAVLHTEINCLRPLFVAVWPPFHVVLPGEVEGVEQWGEQEVGWQDLYQYWVECEFLPQFDMFGSLLTSYLGLAVLLLHCLFRGKYNQICL